MPWGLCIFIDPEVKRLNRTHGYAHALLGHLITDLVPGSAKVKGRLKYDDLESRFINLWLRLDELANGEKAEEEVIFDTRARDGDIQAFTFKGPEREPEEGYFLSLNAEGET